jgi:hypothetical protein
LQNRAAPLPSARQRSTRRRADSRSDRCRPCHDSSRWEHAAKQCCRLRLHPAVGALPLARRPASVPTGRKATKGFALETSQVLTPDHLGAKPPAARLRHCRQAPSKATRGHVNAPACQRSTRRRRAAPQCSACSGRCASGVHDREQSTFAKSPCSLSTLLSARATVQLIARWPYSAGRGAQGGVHKVGRLRCQGCQRGGSGKAGQLQSLQAARKPPRVSRCSRAPPERRRGDFSAVQRLVSSHSGQAANTLRGLSAAAAAAGAAARWGVAGGASARRRASAPAGKRQQASAGAAAQLQPTLHDC